MVLACADSPRPPSRHPSRHPSHQAPHPASDRARSNTFSAARSALLAALFGLAATAVTAQSGTAIFKDADLKLGETLIAEHDCQACHVRRVGGDGSAIYRPNGRINTPGFLRGMVEQCNTELKLSLFPEEVTAIAAVLQRDHYRFKD